MSEPLVLCYHGVTVRAEGPPAVPPSRLERHVRILLGRGWHPATAASALAEGGRRVAVTFDDAEISVESEAFPILRRLGIPATVFVPAGVAGTPGTLCWDALARLAGAGWEIGSHGFTHRPLTELPAGELHDELAESRRAIRERFGSCRSIAYPYGAADERVVDAARRAGYEFGFGLMGVPCPAPGGMCWPRVGVKGGEGEVGFRLRVAAPVRRTRILLGR